MASRKITIDKPCEACGGVITVDFNQRNKRRRFCSPVCSRLPRHTTESKFLESFMAGEPSECWVWQGAMTGGGYGQIYTAESVWVKAHRFSYEHFVGPIPAGLQIDHLCRNRRCVNPHHLEPVPQRINILRGVSIVAQNARKTHCPQGHAYDALNTYHNPASGGRICRECGREYERRYYRHKRRIKREES